MGQTLRLIERLGVKVDREVLNDRLDEIARGEVSLLGSLEEEIAAAPEMEEFLRAVHAEPDGRYFMQRADQLIAWQIATGRDGTPSA